MTAAIRSHPLPAQPPARSPHTELASSFHPSTGLLLSEPLPESAKQPASAAPRPPNHRRWAVPLLVAFLLLPPIAIYLLVAHWPFRYRNVQPLLGKVFASQVSIHHYHLIYFPNPGFVADDLILRRNTAPDLPPVGSAHHLRVEGRWIDMLFLRRRIWLVDVDGLRIVIPPVGSRAIQEDFPPGSSSDFSGPSTVVEALDINDAELDIQRSGGGEYAFPIHHLLIRNLRQGQTISYVLDMENAKPSGRIQAHGSFGPLSARQLGSTPVLGDFLFAPINLADLHGISGNLSATGHFHGTIGDIESTVDASTPDFAVGRGRPTPVVIKASGAVNGLVGDVFVHSVDARTGSTTVHAQGGIVGSPKVTNLDLSVDNGRAEDILRPFLHGEVPVTGPVVLRSHAYIAPATQMRKFLERLRMNGRFDIPRERITNPATERKLSLLSERAQGLPSRSAGNATAVSPVISRLHGTVEIRNGIAYARRLDFQMPGAAVDLNGTFNLRNQNAHLLGNLRMQSDISHLATGFKALLLKPLAPFFKKRGAAAVLPIAITGAPHAYKVQQNMLHRK